MRVIPGNQNNLCSYMITRWILFYWSLISGPSDAGTICLVKNYTADLLQNKQFLEKIKIGFECYKRQMQ